MWSTEVGRKGRREEGAEREVPITRGIVEFFNVVGAAATPMAAGCFTLISRQNPILNGGGWNGNPLPVDLHLHTGRGHFIVRRSAIGVVATRRAIVADNPRVDVMGLDRRRRASKERKGKQQTAGG